MTDGHFRHLPVVEEGRLIGVVSIGDVVKARIDQSEHRGRKPAHLCRRQGLNQ